MAQPSYKNLLKRSRSSNDPATELEDVVQGIALACKARPASDTLFSSQFSTEVQGGRAIQDVSSLSPHLVAQIVAKDSFANNLLDHTFFSSGNIRAVTLARSPSFPFDSNKALKRWLVAERRHGERHTDHAAASRRWKYLRDYGTDNTTEKQETSNTGLLSSPPSSVNVVERATRPVSVVTDFVKKKEHVQVFSEGISAQAPSESIPSSVVLSGVLEKDVASPDVLEKDAGFSSQHQAFSKSNCAESTPGPGVEPTFVTVAQRSMRCISSDRCPQFGSLSVCGRRREMEDTYTVEPDFVLLPCDAMGGCCCADRLLCACSSFHFFGVYDGHGGTQAASFCKVRFHKALTEELIKGVRSFKKAVNGAPSEWCSRWERVMAACFLKIDEEVGGVCPSGGCSNMEGNPNCCANRITPDNVGSTAVVAVIGPCQIIVGNCGDSRAVLSRGGKAVPLSRDHKPDREDEMNRILAAGGRIIYWDGYRVGGLLAMSRAIGDRFLKQYVIAVPEVTCIQRTKEDDCLILASDGLWDAVSSEMACDIARRCLKSQRRKCAKSGNLSAEDTPAGAAAALLTKLALSRGSKDNITVIVVDLKSQFKQP